MAELLAHDLRSMGEDREPAEPFRADVVVAFLEHEALGVRAVVEIGEMKEEAHVERLTDGAEAHHQRVIETGKVFVLERCDDRVGERDGACFDGVARELAALDPNLREDVERVLDEASVAILEMRFDERVMDFVQRARQLLAVAAAPGFAADHAHDLALGERDFLWHRTAVVGVLLDEGDENFVCERARLTKARVGTDDDIFLLYSLVEVYLFGAGRRAFCIMAKQRPGDAQQRVLHEHLVVGMFGLLDSFFAAGCGHTWNKYSPR